MTPDTRLDPAEHCTLPPEGLAERLAWIRTEILPHAVRRERQPSGLRFELHDAPGLPAALDRLIELEAACCSGIEIAHHVAATEHRRILEIRGVDPDSAVFAAVEPRPAPDEPPAAKPGARFAKAAGLGAAFGLLVCCALPVAGAALVGAAAAPLASLDDPLWIGATSLASGGLAFAWFGSKRHQRASNGAACGPDC